MSARLVIISAVIAAAVLPGIAMARARQDKPRDLDTHHLFTPPTDRQSWEKRRGELRRQVLFSAGLWPMPEKTPLNPKVTGKVNAEDYTIENVALETRPGFFLCGNLYRPKGKKGQHPGIVNPHGHWTHGRLEMQPDVPKADPNGKMGDGRGNLVSIGVNLARQGFVVFAYDAVGYNDTNQVSHDFAKSLDAWANGVSEMGLQLWDSIRVVDYLQSLSDVDKNRIGCTGASGGGSQTFLLTAVDDRVKVSVPVNMVSAYMQGGCLCENGPGLRVGTDNVEIAAIMAPRPMLMVAATGDWTSKNPQEEWPAVKHVYDLYGAGDRTAVAQFNYQHNYNIESREAMYAWFGKWLLNDPDAAHFKEKPFTADVSKMHAWTDKTHRPNSAFDESALTAAMIADAATLRDAFWPSGGSDLARFRGIYAPALAASLSVTCPAAPAQRRGAGRALVIFSSAADRDRADRVLQAAKGRYQHAEVVVSEVDAMPENALWQSYFSTYNRTPLGNAVDGAIRKIEEVRTSGIRDLDVVGLGGAGTTALFARALCPAARRSERLIVDLGKLDLNSDDAFLGRLYAPGIRRAGDVGTAAMLAAPGSLWLYNTGQGLPQEKLRSGFEAAGGSLTTEPGTLTAEQIAARLK